MQLTDLETPALVLDRGVMERNIERMRAKAHAMGLSLRPHVKTHKCVEVALATAGGANGPIIVSTLKEADHFAAAGWRDIIYGVGIVPGKFAHMAELLRRGVDLKVIVDNAPAARALAAYTEKLGIIVPVLIEIDSDGHRSGIAPGDHALLDVARALQGPGIALRGVLTHAGNSYMCDGDDELRAMAEQERDAIVGCADTLRRAGFGCPIVSLGSTPTAVFATQSAGVTEVRAGVFVFFDLVMHGLGVCAMSDIAVSVLTTVIGHQPQKGWIITDAGWMALSRDRGTARQAVDQGYGQVCDIDGNPLPELIVADANQEHGIVASRDGSMTAIDRFPIGTMLRILPNHACATSAQHAEYRVVHGTRQVESTWTRFNGW